MLVAGIAVFIKTAIIGKNIFLDYDSMDALKKASDKNMIIINEGMQFSAGVNLNYVMDFSG